MNFPALYPAIASSPTAVHTCFNYFSLISPAANTPSILVSIFSLVTIYPFVVKSNISLYKEVFGKYQINKKHVSTST
ncbi:hypothetical protein, partial [Streptobacillus moniliformis]|uniref:hypothetical protein n=1 Tax=Streptobacillus moniliformis TaxID=34105 RepID=UPI000B2FC4C8